MPMVTLHSLFSVLLLSISFGSLANADASSRPVPTNSVTAEDADIRVTFDKSDGLPYKFELLKVGDFYWGEDSGRKIQTVIRKIADRAEVISEAACDSVAVSAGDVRIKYRLTFNGDDAGMFQIHYALKAGTIFVTLEKVMEANGFHLIEVRTPDLVTLRQEDGPSSFVYNNVAGKLVGLASAMPGDVGQDEGVFGGYPNLSILPIVAFMKKKSVCTVEVQGFRNKTVLDVANVTGNNHAMIGAFTPHYERGGANTPDLLINPNPICRIDFAGDYDGNGMVNWLDAAKMVRDYMPLIPSHFFDDKYPWIIQGQPGRHPMQATFDDMEQLTKRISNLIDHNPQICYVSGWCEGGHDTAYPNITRISKALGGEEGFFKFRDQARQMYNTTVSFDDNYDDQYKNNFSGGFFNLDNIAEDANGKPVTFKAWNGTDKPYITGMAHYLRAGGPGETRVDFTASHYGLQGTLLIDAATWWSIRADYDPQHPASASTNLIEGKYRLFDRFLQKYHLAVVSELLRFPAIGHVSLVCDGPGIDGGHQYGGAGTDIPFLNVALQRSIYYGSTGGNSDAISPSDALYNNTVRHGWLKKDASDSQITDVYYLNYLPWFKLHDLDVLSFEQVSGRQMILSKNSSIAWANQIEAKYQGKTILQGDDVTCPMDDNRIAFYSGSSDKTLSYPLPPGNNNWGVRAEALYADHQDSVPVSTDNGLITVKVKKQTPVVVYLKMRLKVGLIDPAHFSLRQSLLN